MALASCLYMSIVGLYDELPSDVYIHLEYFKQVSVQLQSEEFQSLSGLNLISKPAQYWYHLPTLISHVTETNFQKHLEIYASINIMVLLICIYEFAQWLFKAQIRNERELMVTALLSCLFFALHFGINVFAFIRYYAIAPTILSYCIYLTSIVCLINYYQSTLSFTKFFIISVLLFLTAFIFHAQESLFILIIYSVISALLFIKNTNIKFSSAHHFDDKSYRNSVFYIFPSIVVVITTLYFYVTHNFELPQINSTKFINLNELVDIGENFFILDPNKQFYTVLTHWGLFIIVIYVLVYRRLFTNQPVILAAMLIPLITVFNPYFNNLFLRIAGSDVLWRFLYMLPLYLVAARIVTGLCFDTNHSMLKIGINYVLSALVFILLLPISTSAINLPYSRIYSLSEVHSQARPAHWQDMLDFLQTLPDKETIISDPVTGYLISAWTKHQHRRYKFYYKWMLDPYEFDNYSDHPLKKYSGKLFIVNQRKGMSTATAKIARHWNPHNLKLTDFYKQALIDHINEEPVHFELLWQADQIKIYRINY